LILLLFCFQNPAKPSFLGIYFSISTILNALVSFEKSIAGASETKGAKPNFKSLNCALAVLRHDNAIRSQNREGEAHGRESFQLSGMLFVSPATDALTSNFAWISNGSVDRFVGLVGRPRSTLILTAVMVYGLRFDDWEEKRFGVRPKLLASTSQNVVGSKKTKKGFENLIYFCGSHRHTIPALLVN
jgi:hypothetical protein